MKKQITYKQSGVDIEKANEFVDGLGAITAKTMQKAVLKRKGSFGALFSLEGFKDYKNPILVSSTDGVGTKLLIANTVNKHDTVGIDLVAMNVNDVLCCGAKPLFFLDYIACGKLQPAVLSEVMKGIAQGVLSKADRIFHIDAKSHLGSTSIICTQIAGGAVNTANSVDLRPSLNTTSPAKFKDIVRYCTDHKLQSTSIANIRNFYLMGGGQDNLTPEATPAPRGSIQTQQTLDDQDHDRDDGARVSVVSGAI